MSREGALWIGGLEPYMDEEFLKLALQMMGEEITSIKVIKNKFTGEPASYGFVNFESDPAALMAMHKLNGKIIPNSQPPVRFKLNHNSTRLMPGEKDYSVWVGDLTPDVDDLAFYKFFSARFTSVKAAKVVLDTAGFSKGYGFIRFSNEQEQQTALISMQGITGLGGKGLKVSIAVPKAKLEAQRGFKSSSATDDASGGGGAGGGSIADSLPPTALAAMVSSVSGNPNAGAAIVAEAQNAEYQKYWQQYYQQYQAWQTYQQQQQQYQQWQAQQAAAAAAAATGETASTTTTTGSDEPTEEEILIKGSDRPLDPTVPGYCIFEGDDLELIEHTWEMDTSAHNEYLLATSEELWEALMEMLWWSPDEESERKLLEEQEKELKERREKARAAALAAKKAQQSKQ